MRRKLFFAAMLFIAGAFGFKASAQSWTAPTLTGEDPVSGTTYKLYNVGATMYLSEGQTWFGWSTTAILSSSPKNFTFTGANSSFTLRTERSGNNKMVFTSGNNIPGDAMHVDGGSATNYGCTKLANGYYHIHDAGGNESSPCWGYGTPSGQSVAGVVAHADATAAGWDCEWVFLTDVSAIPLYEARLKLYKLLLTAYGEGANTDAASAVYENTNATITQLKAAADELDGELKLARLNNFLEGKTASVESPIDITEFVLVNPDFEVPTPNGQMPPGWTITIGGQNCGQQNRTDTNPETGLAITNFIEAWHPSAITPGVIAQTVNALPEGTYVLECDASVCHDPEAGDGTDITGASLFIKSSLKTERQKISNLRLRINHYSVSFIHGGTGSVQFGLEAASNINANWLSADNFKIFYAGGVDLTIYIQALADAVAEFNAFEGSVDATLYASLKTTVDALNTNYSTSAEYQTAIEKINAINDYIAALADALIVESGKMNATVLAALQAAIATEITASSSEADFVDATTALTTATSNARTSINNYAELKSILDAANGYSAECQASYAATETIAPVLAAYNNGTFEAVTAELRTAATAALIEAFAAQGSDVTYHITNPSFETGYTQGWTFEGSNDTGAKPNSDGTYTMSNIDGAYLFNIWSQGNPISQTIEGLPQGVYNLMAIMGTDGGHELELFGNDSRGTNTSIDKGTGVLVGVEGIKIVDGRLTIQAGTPDLCWYKVDNFRLFFVRDLTDEDFEDLIVTEFNDALATAKAFDQSTITTAAGYVLQTIINTYDGLTYSTVAEYEAAIAGLNGAVATAESIVAPYATWNQLKEQSLTLATGHETLTAAINKVIIYVETLTAASDIADCNTMAEAMIANYSAWDELKKNADALAAVSNNNATANAELNGVITEQFNNLANAPVDTKEQVVVLINVTIPTATATLKAAMEQYVRTAEPVNDECFDLTFMITNPHFTEGNGGKAIPTGWTLESGSITEHRLATHNFEAYHMPFNLSQTIPNLPKGTYKVTLQGFARHDGADKDKTNLYCGIVNQQIKDINDEYSTTSFYDDSKPEMGDSFRDATAEIGGTTVYRPNGMTGSYYWFQETNPMTGQPFYTNEVQTLVETDGDLKIGFKCETGTDWVIWDNFHLYYYGSAIAVAISEDQPISFSKDVENANITLKRTFTAGKWNTIALPFDMSDAEVKAAFGDDAQVATVEEETDGTTDSTINFYTAADAAITANVPVLLKTSIATFEGVFNGKTVKAGEAIEVGTNFDFVGTYAATTTIAEGDYFIANNQLWKSAGNTTIKGTRAYLKSKAAGVEIKGFNIFDENGEATAIDAADIEGLNIVSGKVYDLSGRAVKNPARGIYIMNGKKVIVK